MYPHVTRVTSDSLCEASWRIEITRFLEIRSLDQLEPDAEDIPKDIRRHLLEWLGVDPETDFEAFIEEMYDGA